MASSRLGTIDFGLNDFAQKAESNRQQLGAQLASPRLGDSLATQADAALTKTTQAQPGPRPDALAAVPVAADTQVEKEDDDQPGLFRSTVNSFFVSGADIVSDLAGGVAVAQEAAENFFTRGVGPQTEIEDRAFFRMDKDLDRYIQESLQVNPEFADHPLVKTAGAIGSAGAFVAGGIAGALAGPAGAVALPMLMGGASASTKTTDELIAMKKAAGKPVTAEDFNDAAGMSALIGMSEGLPFLKPIKALNNLTRGQFGKILQNKWTDKRAAHLTSKGENPALPTKRNIWKEMGKGVVQEGLQEAVSEMGFNWIAKDYVGYDPERGYFAGTGDAAGYGGAAGGVMNGILGLLTNRRIGKIQQAMAEQEARAVEDPAALRNISQKAAENVVNPSTGTPFTEKDLAATYQRIVELENIADEGGTESEQKSATADIKGLKEGLRKEIGESRKEAGKPIDALREQELNAILNRKVGDDGKASFDIDDPRLGKAAADLTSPNNAATQAVEGVKAKEDLDDATADEIIEATSSSSILDSQSRVDTEALSDQFDAPLARARRTELIQPSAVGRVRADEAREAQELATAAGIQVEFEEAQSAEEIIAEGIREPVSTDGIEVDLVSPQATQVPQVAEAATEISNLNRKDMVARAKPLGIKQISKLNKTALATEIAQAEVARDTPPAEAAPAAPTAEVAPAPEYTTRKGLGPITAVREAANTETVSDKTFNKPSDTLSEKEIDAAPLSAQDEEIIKRTEGVVDAKAQLKRKARALSANTKTITKGAKAKPATPAPKKQTPTSARETDTTRLENAVTQRDSAVQELAKTQDEIANAEKVLESLKKKNDPRNDALIDQVVAAVSTLRQRRGTLALRAASTNQEAVKEGAESVFDVSDDTSKITNAPDPAVYDFNPADKYYPGRKKIYRNVPAAQWIAEESARLATIAKIKKSLADNGVTDVDVLYIEDPSKLPAGVDKTFAKTIQTKWDAKVGGFYRQNKKGQQVVLFGRPGDSIEKIQWIAFHEIAGHYGFSKLFGNEFNKFLGRVAGNEDIATAAYALRTRWPDLDSRLQWQRGQEVAWVRDENGRRIRVNRKALLPLIEEHIAELAAAMSDPSNQSKVLRTQGTFMKRVVAFVKHIIRKSGFGKIVDEVSDADLLALVSEAYIGTVGNGKRVSPAYAKKVADKNFNLIKPIIEQPGLNVALKEAEKDAALRQGADIASINAIEDLMAENTGDLQAGWWGRLQNRWLEAVGKSPVLRHFTTYQGIKSRESFQRLRGVALAQAHKFQVLATDANKIMKKMDTIQKRETLAYFKQKDANVSMIPGITAKQADTIQQSKEALVDLGQRLVDLGVLERSTFESNKGSYLPTRYWKYFEGGKGGRLTVSPLNYLKRQKDLSTAERHSLGQIEDPSLIIPETISTIGRDIALMEFSENIATTSLTRKFGWVLGNVATRELNGRKMTRTALETERDHSLQVLTGMQENMIEGDAVAQAEQELKIGTISGLLEDMKAEVIAEAEAIAKEEGRDLTGQEMLDRHYKQIPNEKKFGSLRGSWVHPDLFNEFVDAAQAFDPKNATFVDKLWQETKNGHRLWKQLKVPANIPTFMRNQFGNLALLDISSNRNMATLMKWTSEEAIAMATNEPTKYGDIAMRHGAIAGSFSAQELTNLKDKWGAQLKRAATKMQEEAAGKKTGMAKGLWWMASDNVKDVLDIMSNAYGNSEGVFKAARIRDHIETWEKQNGRRYDDLSGPEKEVVEVAAVQEANRAIFDYGDIPHWLRQVRQSPFGAPFLTFTYKALPAMVRNTALHPQKMVKYMILPYILSQAAFSALDWDDDEIQEAMQALPEWTRDKSTIHMLPFKTADGQIQFVDFSYLVPWAPITNTISTWENSGTVDAVKSFGGDLGILGGPWTSMGVAMKTNLDPFTKREIVRPGSSNGEAMMGWSQYLTSLWLPSWLASSGTLGKMLDKMGAPATPFSSGRPLNQVGQSKETAATIAGRTAGINVYQVNPEISRGQNIRAWRRKENEIKSRRSDHIRNRKNLSDAEFQSKMRDVNERLKLLRQKRNEFLNGG